MGPRGRDQGEGRERELLMSPSSQQKREARHGSSLVVQWLGLCALTAEGPGSIPGQGTKIPQAAWHSQNKKKKWEARLTITKLTTNISKLSPGTLHSALHQYTEPCCKWSLPKGSPLKADVHTPSEQKDAVHLLWTVPSTLVCGLRRLWNRKGTGWGK